jgi:hypothetical protein
MHGQLGKIKIIFNLFKIYPNLGMDSSSIIKQELGLPMVKVLMLLLCPKTLVAIDSYQKTMLFLNTQIMHNFNNAFKNN